MIQTNCIMLIDDNKIDNFFHERVIIKSDAAKNIIVKESGQSALDYLQGGADTLLPNVIFLDINMPGMSGWDFIELYRELDPVLKQSMIIVMLSTSDDPDDKTKAESNGIVLGYKTKPLTKEILDEVLMTYNLNSTH